MKARSRLISPALAAGFGRIQTANWSSRHDFVCLPVQAESAYGLQCDSKAACKSSTGLTLTAISPSLEMLVALLVGMTLITATVLLLMVRPYLIPPGPRRIPVLGNLYIFFSRPDIAQLAASLRQRYGDVYSLYLGKKLMIVVNGLDLIKEAFVTQGDSLLDRPQGLAYERFTKNKGVMNTNGKHWRDNRRFIMQTFRNFGVGQDALENTVAPEITRLIQNVLALDGAPFDPRDALRYTTARVIFKVILDKTFDNEESPELEMFIKAADSVLQNFGVLSILHFVPLLELIPGDIFNMGNIIKEDKKLRSFMEAQVEIRAGHLATTGNARCLADSYLHKIQRNEEIGQISPEFEVDNLVQILLELVVAGTDSTATTLEWLFLYLALNPHEQDTLHREIDSQLAGAFPTLTDRARLPYLEAAILEAQRLADAVPFAVTRSPSKDLALAGFRIPRGCIVVPCLASALMDPELFPNPNSFRPSRFLGKRNVRPRDLGVIPFNIGKRNCLGEKLAKVELLLVAAAMLQSFRFVLPQDEPALSVEGVVGATRKPHRYKLQALPRFSSQE